MGKDRHFNQPSLDAAQRNALSVAGIDREMDLSVECASFYLVEDVWNRLFDWDGDTRFTKGERLPDEGLGTKRERLAQRVLLSLQERETRLADTFAKYIVLACGGELRHLNMWMGSGAIPIRAIRREDTDRLTKDSWETVSRPVPVGKAGERHHPVTQDVVRMMRDIDSDASPGRTRGIAWGSWYDIAYSGGNPADVMAAVADSFSHPIWRLRDKSSYTREHCTPLYVYEDDPTESPQREICELRDSKLNYGGPSWARPARLVSDYYAGRITPRTFVDRCWSIQHNGGSLFDKVWATVPLQRTLMLQALSDSYPRLVHGGDTEAQALWKEYHGWEAALPLAEALGWRPGEETRRLLWFDEMLLMCQNCGDNHEKNFMFSPCGGNVLTEGHEDYELGAKVLKGIDSLGYCSGGGGYPDGNEHNEDCECTGCYEALHDGCDCESCTSECSECGCVCECSCLADKGCSECECGQPDPDTCVACGCYCNPCYCKQDDADDCSGCGCSMIVSYTPITVK